MNPSFDRGRSFDVWPGFVDALSALLLVILFTLTVFVVIQRGIEDLLVSKDDALHHLNETIQNLRETLDLKERKESVLRARIKLLQRDQESVAQLLKTVQTDLVASENRENKAQEQIQILAHNLGLLQEDIARLNQAIEASQDKLESKHIQIQDLKKQVQHLLQEKVQELSSYRSDFFGTLKKCLGNRSDIRVVGDRFVLQSEVLFPTGSTIISEPGNKQLAQIAQALKELSAKIPEKIQWVLRVDGHTDKRPIQNAAFPSNWDLSTARALAVVKRLVRHGVPADRLVAAGLGESYPLEKGHDEQSFARNRRIEFRLDQQ